jgi:thiol-disulfide isomerase/thioredoxin
MKQLFYGMLLTVVLAGCATQKVGGYKVKYSVVPDTKPGAHAKILKGIINKATLDQDTAFAWFRDNMKYGTADAAAVNAFAAKKDLFTMVVFGGTWCEDTQNLLPVFYRLVEKSGYPESNITLVAVDRQKTSTHNLHTQYKITNVPTFIVLKDGKEVGRVVEYGSQGAIDKELGEIVSKL